MGRKKALPVLILHGTKDKATKYSGSRFFYDHAGSSDKTFKLYEGHYHDLLNNLDKEVMIARGYFNLYYADRRKPAVVFL